VLYLVDTFYLYLRTVGYACNRTYGTQRSLPFFLNITSDCAAGMEIVGKRITLAFLFTSYLILPLNEAVGNIMPGRGNVAIELAYLEAALSCVFGKYKGTH